jgi:hypothetical protein
MLNSVRWGLSFDESGGHLGETIDARWNIAVEAARDGGSTAGTGHQEHRLVAFDHRFGRADITQP